MKKSPPNNKEGFFYEKFYDNSMNIIKLSMEIIEMNERSLL